MELHGKSVFISAANHKGYNLEIKMDEGMESGRLERKRWVKTENKVNYYEYTNEERRKKDDFMACLCGYEGVPEKAGEEYLLEKEIDEGKKYRVIERVPVVIDESAPLEKRYVLADQSKPLEYFGIDKKVHVFPFFVCPVCKKSPDILLEGGYHFMEKTVAANCRLVPQGLPKNRAIEWDIIKYQGFSKKPLTITKSHYYLEVDMENGESVMTHGGERKRVTFGLNDYSPLAEQFIGFRESPKEEEVLQDFLKTCLKMRGVHYKSLEEILYTGEKDLPGEAVPFLRVMPFLRYPKLETMTMHNWARIPLFFQERLNQASHSKISVMEALTGHRSKMIRTLAERKENLELAMLFGQVIHDPNNLRKLLIQTERNIGEGSSTRAKSKIYEREEAIFDLWKSFSREMLLFFRELYADEKQFIHGLFKLQRSIEERREYRVGKREEPEFNIKKVGRCLNDTYNAFKMIKKLNPFYELNFRKDLKKLHDDLARDYRRLEQENLPIPYEKERFHLYERTVDGYSFVLAKDTDELIQAGEEMDICVANYREEVLCGESVIVFVYDQKKERCLCIELEGSGTQLLQAKRYGNGLPDEKEAGIVKKWCEQCQICTNETYDLKALNLLGVR